MIHQTRSQKCCLLRVGPVGRVSACVGLCVALQSGCGTTSGEKKQLNAGTLAQIKALEAQVIVEKPFSVYLAQGRDASTGWIIGGIIGGAIEKSSQAQADAEDTKRFAAALGDFNCQAFTQETLVAELRRMESLTIVTAIQPSAKPDLSASNRLAVTIHQWGLMAGSQSKDDKRASAGLSGTAVLNGPNGKKIWERVDSIPSGNVRSWSELSSSPELLRKDLEQAAQRYCRRLVSEMRYAR